MLVADPSTSAPGRVAATAATWPVADLERRVLAALDFARAVVADFGETGYVDAERPVLGFGPEKVLAEAAMLAHAVHGASASAVLGEKVAALAAQLDPLVRSPQALADLALRPEQAFRRALPHVLLTAMGRPDAAFDDLAAARCARVLAHAVDQPATVLAERRWLVSTWGRPLPAVPDATAGTVLERPFDLLGTTREDPYGLTHLLFYVTGFGHRPGPALGRPRSELLADVDALVVRYLDHGDYDLLGELLMAWPLLRAPWSPTATFAFGLLAHVEDEVGLLPCGNVDPRRLAALTGAERTRYARAASYHTALVMGFLCAAALRGGPPPVRPDGPAYADDAWTGLRSLLDGHPGDWLAFFDARDAEEKRTLAPMLGGLAVSQALRRSDVGALQHAVTAAHRLGLPGDPLRAAADDVLAALGAAAGIGCE